MKKGNKTIEEILDEDNENNRELDFDLYQQPYVDIASNKLLDIFLERKDSLQPLNLNKFTSFYTSLPIRREQSFQYLVDPTLGNSIIDNNCQQQENPDNYLQNFKLSDFLEQKGQDTKQYNSLFCTRNESNKLINKNVNQDVREQNVIDLDNVNENYQNNSQINRFKNQNKNLNYRQSKIQKHEIIVSEEDESLDSEDVQEQKYIQIESPKNYKKNKFQEEEIYEITEESDDDKDGIHNIIQDSDSSEEPKNSKLLTKSKQIVDLETMEEEKKKKLQKPIRKNYKQQKDLIEIVDDSEDKENYKLAHVTELKRVSSMNDSMNLSGNMKLRQFNRKQQSELNRERIVQIQKKKSHQQILEKMKKKLKNLIKSNQMLCQSNTENQRLYQQSTQQLQLITADLTEKQKQIIDFQSKYAKNQVDQIQLKTLLENKTNEVENLKESIKISDEAGIKILQKLIQLKNKDNLSYPQVERSVHINEIQQKLDELENQCGNKSLELTQSDDMFEIFCVLHSKIINMQQDIKNQEDYILQLEKYKDEKEQLQIKARINEDQLDFEKKNNENLINELRLKENNINQLQIQIRNYESIKQNNDRLQSEVNNLQKQLKDKEKLIIEQEIIHEMKINKLLGNINNPELKSSLKKQLGELMDVNDLVSQQSNQSKQLVSENANNKDKIRIKPQTTKVYINKNSEINDECILLKKALNKLYKWELKYDGYKPANFIFIDIKRNKKVFSVNIEVNSDDELVFKNKSSFNETLFILQNIVTSDESDKSKISKNNFAKNFWLVAALQLKEYLINEDNFKSLDDISSNMNDYISDVDQKSQNIQIDKTNLVSQNQDIQIIEDDSQVYNDDLLEDDEDYDNEEDNEDDQICNKDSDDQEDEDEETIDIQVVKSIDDDSIIDESDNIQQEEDEDHIVEV